MEKEVEEKYTELKEPVGHLEGLVGQGEQCTYCRSSRRRQERERSRENILKFPKFDERHIYKHTRSSVNSK